MKNKDEFSMHYSMTTEIAISRSTMYWLTVNTEDTYMVVLIFDNNYTKTFFGFQTPYLCRLVLRKLQSIFLLFANLTLVENSIFARSLYPE